MSKRKHSVIAGVALCSAIAFLVAAIAPLHAEGTRRAPAYFGLNMTAAWERIGDFCAKRIAIGEPEHPVVTICGQNDDTQIYRLNDTSTFEPIAGAIGASVSPFVDDTTRFFIITGDRRLLLHSQGGGVTDTATPCVRELSSGGPLGRRWDWMIGCPQWPDGWNYPISRRTEAAYGDFTFHDWPGAAVRVSTGLTDAVAWVVNSINTGGGIYRQTYCKSDDADESALESAFCEKVAKNWDPGWEKIPGCARAIANGGQNRVWIIGCDTDVNGEGSVYQYAGAVQGQIATSRWTRRLGRAKEIAVDKFGRPWLIKADGGVWRWKLDLPGKFEAIESDPPAQRKPNPN